ncbi:MAG TPA: outer capsid protein Hoc [candidate division Zixibacteria bacterium]|nr:outer capsid protein Hoc [candidate division Zixibacteria bacterium]
MSNAVAGVGTQFKRGDGASSETFTAIAEITRIGGPGQTRELIDVTSLDSTGGWREFIAGFRDGGELTLEMNFTLDGYSEMLTDFLSDDSVNYQIVLPNTEASVLDFAGFVMDLPLDIDPADAIKLNVTIKLTGAVSLTS